MSSATPKAVFPRKMRLTRSGSTYLVVFHFEPLEPELVAEKCSNPACEDKGKFAVAVVVENVYQISHSRQVPVESAKLWEENAQIIRLRWGHGQTHCHSRLCEKAMRCRNYLSTIQAFRVKLSGVSEREIVEEMSRGLAPKARRKIRKEIKLAKKMAREAEAKTK